MNPMPELIPMLKQLRLSGILDSIESRNRQAIEEKFSYMDFLATVVQDPVAEEGPDQPVAVGTDCLGLAQTPLGVLKLVGDRLRRHVVIDGGTGTGSLQAGMNGHQFQVMINLDGVVRGLEPHLLVNQRKRRGVMGLLKLDMAVAMQLNLAPDGDLHRDIG